MNVIFPGKTEATQVTLSVFFLFVCFSHVLWPLGYKQMKVILSQLKQSPLGNPRACGI